MSSGLGKEVFIVRPRVPSSSARSGSEGRISSGISQSELEGHDVAVPFCTRSWAAVTFFFLGPTPSAFASFCCCCF